MSTSMLFYGNTPQHPPKANRTKQNKTKQKTTKIRNFSDLKTKIGKER